MTREELLDIVADARDVGEAPDLRGAALRGVDLSGVDLSGAELRGADLSGASLSGADLSGADLERADLRGADLRGADLRWTSLDGADFRRAILPSGWVVRQWSGCGPLRRQTTLAVRPGGHTVWCGGFAGSVDKFSAAIEMAYADNTLHLEDYRAIVADMRRIIAREADAIPGNPRWARQIWTRS